ncbi:MAG: hypothetical protein ACRD0P_12590 [Stackebrandtia sp.]
MAKVKVVLNRKGVSALLKGGEVLADLESRAAHIAAAAGDGMKHDSTIGARRARASVYTATYKARRAEATNRTLSRSLDAGRR